MELINELRTKQKEIDGLKTMMDENVEDRDMLGMVTEELDEAVKEEKRLQQLLLQSLLPRDDADERGSILEELEVKRLPCLQWTYLRCMRGTHKRKDGNLK